MARRRKITGIKRLAHLHGRLFASAVLGIAVYFAVPGEWRLVDRLLCGWDAGVICYLIIALFAMARADTQGIRNRAALEDEGAWAVMALTMLAIGAAIAAVMVLLVGDHNTLETVLGLGTILLSWFFMHTTFTLLYAHEFYGEGADGDKGGLGFPGTKAPDYWDFSYFSLVLGMTFQVSDVQISSKAIRRVATLHGVLSFFFNLAILALAVNAIASG